MEVVSNDYGNRTTPSLVLYDSACQEFLVGEPALAKAHKLQASSEAAALLTPAKIVQLQFSKLKQDGEAFIGQVLSANFPRLCVSELIPTVSPSRSK